MNLTALICIVCVYSTVFMVAFKISQFNFDGGFMLLHGVNPLIALAFFIFSEKCEFKSKKQLLTSIFLAPTLFMVYLLFDLIFYFCNGEFVYGLLPSDLAYLSPIVAFAMYGLLVAVSYGLIELKNRYKINLSKAIIKLQFAKQLNIRFRLYNRKTKSNLLWRFDFSTQKNNVSQ